MALEVVTGGKNDKTEKNDQEYVRNKRTWDGTCVLFCVPPSFALIDNKYILSCAITNSPLNESNKLVSWCFEPSQPQRKSNEELSMKQ